MSDHLARINRGNPAKPDAPVSPVRAASSGGLANQAKAANRADQIGLGGPTPQGDPTEVSAPSASPGHRSRAR